MVASSFGKLVMKENPREGVREEDLALALLMMITNNIGQVAHLNAQLHNCNKIFFVGSFLRHNPISCRRLAFAIDFWSNGSMDALFSVHEGYFGALGTFLRSAFGEDVDRILQENATEKASNHIPLARTPTEEDIDATMQSLADNPTKGWGRNIRKFVKWSTTLTNSEKKKATGHKRVRSSSDDFFSRKGSSSPKLLSSRHI